jgi:hypothetical protein
MQPLAMIRSIFGNCHAMLNHFQHGVMIAICCFFVSGVLCAHHKKYGTYLHKPTTTLPTHENISINQSWQPRWAGNREVRKGGEGDRGRWRGGEERNKGRHVYDNDVMTTMQ